MQRPEPVKAPSPPPSPPTGGRGSFADRASDDLSARPEPVPWIGELEPAAHGSFDASAAAREGVNLSGILDFSVNGNVIGPPPGVASALSRVDVSRYPDRTAAELRGALADQDGVSLEMVVVGNGSTELIWAVARAYLAPGRRAAVLSPTYGEYAVASRAAGAEVHSLWFWPLEGRAKAAASLEQLAPLLAHARPDLVWICHPNNPTGCPFPLGALRALIEAAPRALFVVDEAYLTLCRNVPSAIPSLAGGHVVALRSMTKDVGLAGLRVGYALASPEIADVLRRALPPWNLSGLAQAGALAALADSAHLKRARLAVAGSRAHLVAGLARIGLRPHPSLANFVLVPVGGAAEVTRNLLRRGCAVRDCTSFGLDDCIRIGVRSIEDQELLLAALAEVCGG